MRQYERVRVSARRRLDVWVCAATATLALLALVYMPGPLHAWQVEIEISAGYVGFWLLVVAEALVLFRVARLTTRVELSARRLRNTRNALAVLCAVNRVVAVGTTGLPVI